MSIYKNGKGSKFLGLKHINALNLADEQYESKYIHIFVPEIHNLIQVRFSVSCIEYFLPACNKLGLFNWDVYLPVIVRLENLH